jgi:hypothetical protein
LNLSRTSPALIDAGPRQLLVLAGAGELERCGYGFRRLLLVPGVAAGRDGEREREGIAKLRDIA